MAVMAQLLFVIWTHCVLRTYSRTVLQIGSTPDDWSTFDDNIGWTNGEIVTTSTTLNQKYHGLFDGDTGETLLSRHDLELDQSGTLTMNFTLIFGCRIIEQTDKLSVTLGNESTDYYILNTLNDYPYTTQAGFTIDLFHTEPMFTALCNDSLWSIQSSITSTIYEAHIPIYIAFESSFNYTTPDTVKYWAVTDIVFNVVSTDTWIDDIENNATSIMILIVICVLLFLLFIPLFRYCYKGKKVHDRKRRNLLKHTVSVESTEPELPDTETTADDTERTRYKAVAQQNNALKSELADLEVMVKLLTQQNITIDTEIETVVTDFESLQSVAIHLEKDIVDLEKEHAVKQLELELIHQKMETIEEKVSTQNGAEWVTLASFPTGPRIHLVELNYHELGAVTWDQTTRRLYKYVPGRDKWKLWMECADRLKSRGWITCGDRHNEKVFMYGDCGEMIVFHTRKRNIKIVKKLNRIVVGGQGGQCVMMNGKLHILGGVEADSWHLLWNSQVQTMKRLRTNITALTEDKHFSVIALQKSQKLLLFGQTAEDQYPYIYEYSFADCLWKKSDVMLPFKMRSFGYTVSTNEEHIVLFGGEIDDIFILNVNDMKFKRAKHKCPAVGKFSAFWMDYKDEYKIVLNGMIRESINKGIGDDIFHMIMMRIVTNDVHLVHLNTSRHWRLNIHSIRDLI
eukprot:491683_1